jgi:hypothetical protein
MAILELVNSREPGSQQYSRSGQYCWLWLFRINLRQTQARFTLQPWFDMNMICTWKNREQQTVFRISCEYDMYVEKHAASASLEHNETLDAQLSVGVFRTRGAQPFSCCILRETCIHFKHTYIYTRLAYMCWTHTHMHRKRCYFIKKQRRWLERA